MSLLDYIRDELPADISQTLNGCAARFPPSRYGTWSPSGWYYPGLVQATAFRCLLKWLGQSDRGASYLVLSEVPVPTYPCKSYMDLVVSNRDEELLFLDIRTDFRLSSLERDLARLERTLGSMAPRLRSCFVLYCVKQSQADAWKGALQKWRGEVLVPLPILVPDDAF
jgi:hypothetical protein